LLGSFERLRAKRAVGKIAEAVRKQNQVRIEWHDEGDVAYSAQFRAAHPMMSYIWWLDRRDLIPEFKLHVEDSAEDLAFRRIAPERLSRYPHLSDYPFNTDYFLPVDFEHVTPVEPFRDPIGNSFFKRVRSTPRALRELDAIDAELKTPPGYEFPEGDPLVAVRCAALAVRAFLSSSHAAGLPAIFWS
jgi:hypothetical protein